MITFSNRQHKTHGQLIAAHIGPELIAFFDPALHIVNVAETDVTIDGDLTRTLSPNRFDYLVRECLGIIKTRTNDNRPTPSGPAKGAAVGSSRRLT